MRASRFLVPVAVFAITAGAAYGLTSIARPTPTPPKGTSSATVGVVVPFPYTGDAASAAKRWAAENQANGESPYVAYAPDLPAVAASPSPSAGTGPVEGGADRIPAAPSGGTSAPGGVVDACAGDSPPASCPTGVGGIVQLTLDSLPPMDGMVALAPAAPGTAPFPYFPECPAVDLAPGDLSIGLTVNRPASIELSWSHEDGGAWVTDSATLTTTGPAEDAWNAWAASSSASPTDPEQWIDVCHVIHGLAPGEYRIQATFTDASDSAQSFTYPADVPLTARVGDSSGAVPGHTRRPTIVLPDGVDHIIVNALAPSDQYIAMVAEPAQGDAPGTGGTCDASLVDPSHALPSGDIVGVPLTQQTLPDSVVGAPDYPYLPSQNLSLTSDVTLQTGTDYTVCLFWMDNRGDPGHPRPVAIEAIPIGIPEAYHVSLDAVDFVDSAGVLDGNTIGGAHVRAIRPGGYLPGSETECSRGLDVGFGSGGATWPDTGRNLCTDMTGITGIVRTGIPIDITLASPSGGGDTLRSIVRVDPRCHGACTPRDPEMAMVPLPDVDGHSAGDLAVRVSFDATPGNGRTSFAVGDSRYGTTGPQTPDYPYVDITTSQPDMAWALALRNGVDVSVSVRLHHADAATSLHVSFVSSDPREPLCRVGAGPTPRAISLEPAGPASTTTFHGLCAGASYRVEVRDDSGGIVPVFGTTGWDTTDGHDFSTDTVSVPVHGTITGMQNQGYDYSFTAYSNLWVRSPYTPGAYPTGLDPNVDAAWLDRLSSGGWTMTDDGYSACGSGLSATTYAKPYTGTIEVSHGKPIRVEGHATYRTNQRDASGGWTCDVTSGPGYLGGNVTSVVATADITPAQLIDGVTVRAEDEVGSQTWVAVSDPGGVAG